MVLPAPVFLQICPSNPMGLKSSQPQSCELFPPRLDEQLNLKHPPVRLATLIDWSEIERTFLRTELPIDPSSLTRWTGLSGREG